MSVPPNKVTPAGSKDPFFVSSVTGTPREQRLEVAAFHGPAGDWCRAIAPYTEADPAGVLASYLVSFGSAVGAGPYIQLGKTQHRTNEFVLLVGKTSNGRKGDAMNVGMSPVLAADPVWADRVKCGYGSAEAIILSLSSRGPYEQDERTKERPDPRLLWHEGEFAQILKVAGREGSTMSSVLRNAWDGKPLQNHTVARGSLEAKVAHVSLLAGITPEELVNGLAKTDVDNGFMNRLLLVEVDRPWLLPIPDMPPDNMEAPHVDAVKDALRFARREAVLSFDDQARERYFDVYETLGRDRLGPGSAVCARGAPHVIRVSMLFALLDQTRSIRLEHLDAALALWWYCARSAARIFGDGTGDLHLDKLLAALGAARERGLTRTEINAEVFSGNRTSEQITVMLDRLVWAGRVRRSKEETGGRPADRSWLTEFASPAEDGAWDDFPLVMNGIPEPSLQEDG